EDVITREGARDGDDNKKMTEMAIFALVQIHSVNKSRNKALISRLVEDWLPITTFTVGFETVYSFLAMLIENEDRDDPLIEIDKNE
ncbi:hypothetical protein PMAYCL1PPCAC_01729, partial [Pristionchus mayeri]